MWLKIVEILIEINFLIFVNTVIVIFFLFIFEFTYILFLFLNNFLITFVAKFVVVILFLLRIRLICDYIIHNYFFFIFSSIIIIKFTRCLFFLIFHLIIFLVCLPIFLFRRCLHFLFCLLSLGLGLIIFTSFSLLLLRLYLLFVHRLLLCNILGRGFAVHGLSHLGHQLLHPDQLFPLRRLVSRHVSLQSCFLLVFDQLHDVPNVLQTVACLELFEAQVTVQQVEGGLLLFLWLPPLYEGSLLGQDRLLLLLLLLFLQDRPLYIKLLLVGGVSVCGLF